MGQVIALRHVAFEDLGLLDPLLRGRGHAIATLDAATDDLSPADDPTAVDLLVVLGGPIGAGDTDAYPFLIRGTEIVARRVAAGRPTLGICLGAQIMARALGSPAYPAAAKEIGWAPLALTAAGLAGPLRHLSGAPVLHWHGDTFDLPAGSDRLASTPACPNQAFRLGDGILALQFHAEAAGTALERWFVGHCVEIAACPGVTVAGLRRDIELYSDGLVERGRAMFGEWLQPLGL